MKVDQPAQRRYSIDRTSAVLRINFSNKEIYILESTHCADHLLLDPKAKVLVFSRARPTTTFTEFFEELPRPRLDVPRIAKSRLGSLCQPNLKKLVSIRRRRKVCFAKVLLSHPMRKVLSGRHGIAKVLVQRPVDELKASRRDWWRGIFYPEMIDS